MTPRRRDDKFNVLGLRFEPVRIRCLIIYYTATHIIRRARTKCVPTRVAQCCAIVTLFNVTIFTTQTTTRRRVGQCFVRFRFESLLRGRNTRVSGSRSRGGGARVLVAVVSFYDFTLRDTRARACSSITRRQHILCVCVLRYNPIARATIRFYAPFATVRIR